ncbi:DUF1805 domain-containing protein [Bacillus megaterium]|nr:DUF1805 domain-containing protein [Priestia megaterium]
MRALDVALLNESCAIAALSPAGRSGCTIEQLLEAPLESVTIAAELGIKPGMKGKDAVENAVKKSLLASIHIACKGGIYLCAPDCCEEARFRSATCFY